MNKRHTLNYSIEELKTKLLEICDKPFKVKQIFHWIFLSKQIDFQKMTNLSTDMRNRLSDEFDCFIPEVVSIKESKDKSMKYLVKLQDDNFIEMVYIPSSSEDANIKDTKMEFSSQYPAFIPPYEVRNRENKKKTPKKTLCISTQVGCSRKCAFCATAKLGLYRNLSQEELLMQLYLVKQQKITNLVLMGMGEPLDNLNNVISFLKVLQYNEGLAFSGRRTTISTSGIVPKIYELADQDIKVKLAVSLNSAIDSKRSKLMPINDIYPLKDLKKAVIYFRKKTNFRITFEYIMIDGFNMGKEDIKALIKFCGDLSCKINLIKWNNVQGLSWKSPTENQIESFIEALKILPVAVTYRKSRGEDIAGACGQLAGDMI
ncbi:MAG: 23S rRNA (adenine(2503)-C(2))-methyltransferase RlmN [Candidatus Cloacimonetes bacterium]|nr:23S rRNA (adenine(2503)-C(2))-methyltransferase RlmN [Candidatus Cloacimonadota bacterium]